MKHKTLALLTIAGLTLPVVGGLTATQLQAQVGDRPGGDRAERLIETLDLSAEQADQIRAIRHETREDVRSLHDELRTERQAMHGLMAGTATDAELQAQHDKIQTLQRQLADQRFDNMLAIRNVLTPEQRTELAEQLAQRREDFRGRLQGRRENRPLRDDRP